jgi:hypothetical protein
VDNRGFEPRRPACKAGMLPLTSVAQTTLLPHRLSVDRVTGRTRVPYAACGRFGWDRTTDALGFNQALYC